MRKLRGHEAFEQLRREFRLGVGEAQAIALAQASNARLIAIEDRNGSNACKILKLPFTGALGILLRMREKELISGEEVLRKLEILRKYGRYRARDCRRREAKAGGNEMTKTMSIRMDEENYDFLNKLSKEERGDLSKAVRELVNKGRLMLAVERYKEGKASLGLAAELADLTLGEMINTLAEYGVQSNLETEDYLKGLENLRKEW